MKHNPRVRKIQNELGLQDDASLWGKIRLTATTLLTTAGILIHPAYGKNIQQKKRELANDLEQLYPNVFGATPGSKRDFELQKTTSYAILTYYMSVARRHRQTKKASTRGKRKADASLPSVREKRVLRGAPSTAAKATKAKSIIRVKSPVAETIRLAPLPGSESAHPVELAPSAAEPALPAQTPPCATNNDLVIIFSTEPDILALYSPMTWAEMVPSGASTPSLSQVHTNLVEDGLDVECDQYTLYDPDDAPVRSDRCLNFLLKRCLKKGVVEAEWKVVIDG